MARSKRIGSKSSAATDAAPVRQALRVLFKHSFDGMLLLDQRDCIVEANPRASQLFRVSRAHLVGKRIHDVARVRRRRLARGTARATDPADSQRSCVTIEYPDEATVDAAMREVRGVVPGMRIVILQEQSTERPAIEALERASRLLRESERVGQTGAWQVDLEAGVVVRTPELCRMMELPTTARTTSIEESYGTYTEASRSIAREAFTATLAHGTPYDLELEAVTERGNRFWVREVCKATMRRGRVASVIGIVQDISERRRLAHLLTHAAGEERARIGADLHDGLGQELTGLALMLHGAARCIESDNPGLSTELSELSNLASKAVETARAMAHGILPVNMSSGGLTGALRDLSRATTAASGVRVSVRSTGEKRFRPDATAAENLYRIAQEAITNAIKHAHPSRVSIMVRTSKTKTVLVVANDGERIDLDRTNGGKGLQIMRHRARMVGGLVDVRPARSGGTRVRCVVPRSEVT